MAKWEQDEAQCTCISFSASVHVSTCVSLASVCVLLCSYITNVAALPFFVISVIFAGRISWTEEPGGL